MPDIRKLIESMDAIEESVGMKTVANSEAFVNDVAKAFNGRLGQKLSITVELRGSNVLEYTITKIVDPDDRFNDNDSNEVRNLMRIGR